ncbi:unnamed protein product [Ceutorhynchus assimilis]|uniref:Uncharacterized protein n=1 Tax=Ceutorhynchus assimilis TaxID=467358 RepID=A0A9N9QRL2_9CUCU|nr:unnamed protein product [Ceutorhynchus assimilis]
METTIFTNISYNYPNHTHEAHFARKEKLCWVLVALVAVLPMILLALRICKKISEYRESRRQCRNGSSDTNLEVSDPSFIYTIPVKQDYVNLAPPCYSLTPPTPTYELPPPYSPTIR